MLRSNSRCVSWLRDQLPELVAANVITSDAAAALERHYESQRSPSRNVGVVLLAIIGSALVAGGIILLIAHNWDELSRPVRTAIAFAPLVIAQGLGVFVLLRRDESQAWRESVAIFDVAAVATAISLVSQTFQIQGTFADFMCIWLVLSIPIVYLFRTATGALAYVTGSVVWLFAGSSWFGRSHPEQLFFWLFLLAIAPYYIGCFRRDRFSLQTTMLSIFLTAAVAFGLGNLSEFTNSNLGGVAFAGLWALVYLCGMKFFPREDGRLPGLALLGGIGIGIIAIVLSFEETWHFGGGHSWNLEGAAHIVGVGFQLLFPLAATGIFLFDLLRRKGIAFSVAAGALPLVAGVGWIIADQADVVARGSDNQFAFAASLLFDLYALLLGIELLARGVRANSTARANFGLLVIVALAFARFFDSDLSFLTRGLGFIAVGIGFLLTNIVLFKKRAAA